jgi:hypothetical protein
MKRDFSLCWLLGSNKLLTPLKAINASICANKFLHNLIPCFLEVVVQDGIFCLKDLPKHPFSQLLNLHSNLLY